MKKRLFILLALGVAFMPSFAYAEGTLEPQRLTAISQGCTVIQTILDQLQRRDLVARTNRGRAYEAQIKQIDAFTQRMQTNNLSTQALDGPAIQFKAEVDAFRSAYVQYDDRMSTLRQIDCRTKSESFATALEQVRVLRQEVGAEVTKGEESLALYRQALTGLRAILPDAKGGTQ